MPHALAAHARVRHFHAATITNDAFVLGALELAARALPVPLRTENALAKQTVLLRTIGPVVDRLWLFDLAERPTADVVGRRQRDVDPAVVIHTVVDAFQHGGLTFPCDLRLKASSRSAPTPERSVRISNSTPTPRANGPASKPPAPSPLHRGFSESPAPRRSPLPFRRQWRRCVRPRSGAVLQ